MSNYNNFEKYGDYYIGLDVGTGSCGWAVTDTSYNILKVSGKSLWGVRLFPTADTAAERRAHRCARRRVFRNRQRLNLLEQLFDSEISKVDVGFFQRLKNSEFKEISKNNLLGDCTYNDKDFFKEYPTIYHLRYKLMNEPIDDIRLLFLAVHHIIKHRGHFLFENVNNIGASLPELWEQCCSQFVDISLFSNLSEDYLDIAESLKQTLIDMRDDVINVIKTSSDKKADLNKVFAQLKSVYDEISDYEVKKTIENRVNKWSSLLLGYKVSAVEIFSIDESDEEGSSCKIQINSSDYDEQLLKIKDEFKGVVESEKAVYDVIKLQEILKGCKSISEAKVKLYNKHAEELRIFKNLLRERLSEKILIEVNKNVKVANNEKLTSDPKSFYKEIFEERNKNTEKGKICFYYDITHGDKSANKEAIKGSSIYKRLQILAQILLCSSEIYKLSEKEKVLLHRIGDLSIFETQVSADNSVIPYQINLAELDKILKVQSKNFAFLSEKDDAGVLVSDKIKALLTFRIPYYVGPLNNHSKFSWIVKKSQEKIVPWNFESVVDTEKSAEAFIKRMTSKCTYLSGEDVLPKNSIIYSKFMVLNVLNNIRINGMRLDEAQTGLTKKVFDELYCNQINVTQKQLVAYLYNNGFLTSKEELTGFDDEQKVSMSSYVKIKNALGTDNFDINFAESFIKYSTLFPNDYLMIEKRLKREFSSECAKFNENLSKLCRIKFSGWGRLSEKLLTGLLGHNKNSEFDKNSILGFMLNGKGNLMELLSSEYTFSDLISSENSTLDENNAFSYQNLVEGLYVSPSVKRMIWQTLLVVREITKKIMGYEPSRIFVEMARGATADQKGKRTNSRKKSILALYDKCRQDFDISDLSSKLENEKDSKLLSDKIYLYYTQLGKSVYTGKEIKIDEFDLYDIDHIIPQSLTKDDSLDNRVLVEKEINQNDKKNRYPLSSEIQENQKQFWKHLLDLGLISKSKFERLIRSTPLSNSEKEEFIARQLVETRQSTKAIAGLLSKLYKTAKIIYPKAGLTADFKQRFDLIKVRELNDLHHAKDAYCNIVVGNVYYEKFTSNYLYVIENNEPYSFSTSDKSYIFTKQNEKRLQETGTWDSRNGKSISIVKKYYKRNNILMTYKQEERIGALFNQTLYGPEKGTIPKKKNMSCQDYGGYDSDQNSFFSFISYKDDKANLKTKLIGIPLRVVYGLSDKASAISHYLLTEKANEYREPKVLIDFLPFNFILKDNETGFLARVVSFASKGKQLEIKQFNPLVLDEKNLKPLKAIEKFVSRLKNKSIKIKYEKDKSGFTDEDLSSIYSELKDKSKNSVFKNLPKPIVKMLSDVDINNYKYQESEKSEPKLLTIEQKAVAICELIKAFHTESSNLLFLGEKKGSGVKRIKTVLDLEKTDYSILCSSITGFYEKEIRLRDLLK